MPLGDLLGVLGVAFASALVPLVNIEAYLGVRGSVGGIDNVWVLGLAAGLGQMVGKVVWYYLGASSLHWGWVRRRMETPKAQARLETWRLRTHERPVLAGALVFVSAFSGFPPFAILSVLAGQLRMQLALFFGLGLAGRWLRFTAVLGGAGWLAQLLR
ncbi:MAG TPA: VTT domain-containing protein [Nocardioidaceae bacterium]|nr:VTT domain-containing protein [Nocardioidaceae bacterium]